MTGSNEVLDPQQVYLQCERRHIYALLMCAGGYMGAFTYLLRGGVFCNAQTANFVLMSIALGQGLWKKALYYLLPISAYFAGTMISELLPEGIKKKGHIRWDTFLVGLAIVILFLLGLLLDSAPFQITHIAVNFIASMQYNTFRQARDIPMATTFCTNHLRQTGIYLGKWIQTKNADSWKRIATHLFMIACFAVGGLVCAVLCPLFGGKALWGALIPLAVVFVDLLYADLKTEKDYLDRIPRGH